MNNVTVIKAISNPNKIKRVAGYARVSTIDEHQDTSYNTQSVELENEIKSNPSYEFVGVFKDKKSGTTTKGRTEFNAMIELALLGEIDLIITKSITRFARNLIDTISTIRKLKEKNVEVFFQKENISTLDPSIEFLLTILAVHAEEESKNISSNVKWSVKQKINRGGNFTTKLYGYRIDGEEWIIHEEEAKVVRLIYEMYIEGKTYKHIIDTLYKMGIKTSTGKDRWHQGTIESILLNEKYAGHMAYGRRFIHNGNVVTKKRASLLDNMIRNHHDPIVSQNTFDKAIALRESRSRNQATDYVPFDDKKTPYNSFVYSKENERFLKYVIERPKGKYVIPTLYCYNRNHKNRVMLKADNLFILLNDALTNLSSASDTLGSIFTPFLNENIEKCNELNKYCVGDKAIILTNKSSLIKSQKRLPNYIKRLRLFKTSNDIEYLRKFVHKVTIIDSLNIEIKLSLNPIDSLNLFIGSGTVNYKIGNLFKDVSYTIFF